MKFIPTKSIQVMRQAVNYGWVSAKYQAYQSARNVKQFFSGNWLRIMVVVFGFYILMIKDVSLSLNLNSAIGQLPNGFGMKTSLPISWDDDETADVALLSDKKTSKKGGVQEANTYSNIGFLMNPGYAKKHGVPQSIVDKHNKKCMDYIKRFGPVAMQEMHRYGVPASIKLAQGLLESNAGDSRLAKSNNNHFGIKCFSTKCKKGHCSNFKDDTHKDFFRKYGSTWESYREHSKFLQKDRYKHLKELGTKDYEGWAHGLKKAGYATDKRYAQKLIKIIEVLKLHEYDE